MNYSPKKTKFVEVVEVACSTVERKIFLLHLIKGLNSFLAHVRLQKFEVLCLISCSEDQAENDKVHKDEPSEVPRRQFYERKSAKNNPNVERWSRDVSAENEISHDFRQEVNDENCDESCGERYSDPDPDVIIEGKKELFEARVSFAGWNENRDSHKVIWLRHEIPLSRLW